MRYIPSGKVKGHGVLYDGIENRVPWILADGTLDALSDLYTLKNCRSVLDIGCGNGTALEYFSKTAHRLAGIDLNNYLNVACKKEIEFSSVDLNFEKLPQQDQSFDAVFALQVVEHLENPFHIMREAHRVLKDEGLFIISVPNPFTISAKMQYLLTDNIRRWNLRNDHLLFLTKDVMEKTYGSYFEILSSHYQKGLAPFIGRLYKYVGIKSTTDNTKILPRSKHFGDSVCYVFKKKIHE